MDLQTRRGSDFTLHLILGATDVAACAVQLVIDDLAKPAGFSSRFVQTGRSFQFFVEALYPRLCHGQSVKARSRLMDDPAVGLYKDVCVTAHRAVLAFAFDDWARFSGPRQDLGSSEDYQWGYIG